MIYVVAMIVPTGLGAAIGGHAGDANPAAKLLARTCDYLVTHPNVVNASDINEMSENTLYVDGYMLDRLLGGKIGLRLVSGNRILVATNAPARADTVNAVSAARATIGIQAEIIELKTPLTMTATMSGEGASGVVLGWEALVRQVEVLDFDALAIHTPISVDRETALDYYRNGGVNPWGGVEAVASRLISSQLLKPVAHAPRESVTQDDPELYNVFSEGPVDPRIAPEAISRCFLHCVLRGLWRAPQPGEGDIRVGDIACLVSPAGCYGPPHHACEHRRIPIIVVDENATCLGKLGPAGAIHVRNYLEAAGLILSMRAGLDPASIRRPLAATKIKEA